MSLFIKTEFKYYEKSLQKDRQKKKKVSKALRFALDDKFAATVLEGFVKLYHLCQISDTPRHADCN